MILDFLKNRTRAYKGSARQIGFIVGTGRCGTTILAQVLNAHSRICVPPEMQFIVSIGNGERLFDKYNSGELTNYKASDFITLFEQCCPYNFDRFFDYRRHFNGLHYPQTDVRRILRELYDDICFTRNKEVFIEQTPWQGQKLDVLKELFPEMKVIHIVRDGRDVSISFARTPWWSKDVDANLLQWAREVEVIHDFGEKNKENFLELRYEDLVANPKEELIKALNMFALPFEDEILHPEKLIDYSAMFKGEARKHQSSKLNEWEKKKNEVFFKESIFAWKNDKNHDFSMLPDRVRDTLRRFQYELC